MKLEVTFALYTKTNEHKLTQVDTFQVEFQLSFLLSVGTENWKLQRYLRFFREITVFVYILATIVYPHAFSRILWRAQKLRLRFEKLEKRCKHKKSKNLVYDEDLTAHYILFVVPKLYRVITNWRTNRTNWFALHLMCTPTRKLSRFDEPIGYSTTQLWNGDKQKIPNSFLFLGRR